MKRLIEQKKYINDEDIAVESLNPNVTIIDYLVTKVGNWTKLLITIDVADDVAEGDIIKVSGADRVLETTIQKGNLISGNINNPVVVYMVTNTDTGVTISTETTTLVGEYVLDCIYVGE